ncbi:universal stress protein A-like protein [Actinia tenebrosa]|uniref:Universal stress protein A-like protein n=1 Tax=Actinia tenebrosa TaxID=6105 RepID=A0A6P8HCS3_ACTTE|nr:universal stress protein A-like protein [Actinia tenebrosa]
MATGKTHKNTVLIPVDGSKNSIRAFEWYCSHVKEEGDKLVIVHAYTIPPMQAAKHSSVDFKNQLLEWHILIQKAEEKARSILKIFEEGCKKLKGSVSCRLMHAGGNPGEVIMKFVKDEGANLLIVGSRGMGVIRRTFLGSVSDYIVHHASIPVIVVPPK